MKAPALAAALLLLGQGSTLAQTPAPPVESAPSTSAAAPAEAGEPLPPGAPTGDYELSAWCYGALSEYLDIYDRVKPDLRDIDKMFGSSVKNEREPYADDIAASRAELKVLASAVQGAEKASPTPLQIKGTEAIKLGRGIWAPVEGKSQRELARAWLSWGLPDRCDSTAKSLIASSAVLGQALQYNVAPPPAAPAEAPPASAPPAPATPNGASPSPN